VAGIEEIELALVKPWGVGHRQTPQHRFTGGHMNQAAAAGLVLAPAVFHIGFAQGGHIGRCAAVFVDGQPVKVASIHLFQAADERWLPLGHKAPVVFNRDQTVEQGVHQPEAVAAPGQVMAHQRTAEMTGSGKESDVMLALGV